MRRLAVALAAALFVGCTGSTDATGVPFQLSIATPPAATNPGQKVTTTSTAVIVSARFLAPTPCFDLAAGVRQSGSTINVTMTATSRGQNCPATLGVFDYTLVLSPIALGSYHVIVNHVGEAGSTNTTFAADVVVH
jgi:hypothetical protein